MKRKIGILCITPLALCLMLSACQAASSPTQTTESTSEATATVPPTTTTTESVPALVQQVRREKKVILWVDWSEEKLSGDVSITVYVDGELDPAYSTVVDESVTRKSFTFQGHGTKQIRVKINNTLEYHYVIDFDSGEIAP